MDALVEFLVELTKEAVEKADIVHLENESYCDKMRISTHHGSTLHRVYFHYGMVNGLFPTCK